MAKRNKHNRPLLYSLNYWEELDDWKNKEAFNEKPLLSENLRLIIKKYIADWISINTKAKFKEEADHYITFKKEIKYIWQNYSNTKFEKIAKKKIKLNKKEKNIIIRTASTGYL